MNFFLRFLGAKKRNEIRRGKLWEITKLWGVDVWKSEKEVAQPNLRTKREGGEIEAIRPHTLKQLDNETNMTKKADLL